MGRDTSPACDKAKIATGLAVTEFASRGADYKPVASIPSKFETVLFKGPR